MLGLCNNLSRLCDVYHDASVIDDDIAIEADAI